MYLEATRNETLTAEATNNEYVRTTFRPVEFHPVNGKSIFTGTTSGARLFNPGKEPNVGDLFQGKIIQFETTPYTIDGKEVAKITVCAMADENPIELANAQLKRNNACVLQNGKPTVVLETVPA